MNGPYMCVFVLFWSCDLIIGFHPHWQGTAGNELFCPTVYLKFEDPMAPFLHLEMLLLDT